MERIPVRHIHPTQKEQDFSEIFSIRNIHDLLGGEDMVQDLHRHDFYYVLALDRGFGHHDIDFISYTVCDHAVFVVRPGQVHRLELKAGSTGYLMQFSYEFFFPHDKTVPHSKTAGMLLRRSGMLNHYQPDTERFQNLLVLLKYIYREYAGKQERYREIIEANMRIFFIELNRQHGPTVPDTAKAYMQEKLEEFLELLETQVFSYKQVSQYAGMLNLSVYQLNAITKAALGKTSSELITEYVLLEAKRYLLATADQVNQIADHLGYEDVSYFIRFFKKHTGYSPETFRHRSR